MKCLSCGALGAAVLLTLASAPCVSAGVVMAETSVAKGPDGVISSLDKTVYVQGNKRKVDSGRTAEITDLDKSIVYIVNKHDRVYAEIFLPAVPPSERDKGQDNVVLKKTGGTRVIANHPCNEYRTVEGNKLEHVTISACVSENVPGAEELSQFASNMVAHLEGRRAENPTKHDTKGLLLDKQSVLSFRLPDVSRARAYRTASLMTETRVNKVQVQRLPDDTFEPPSGYKKLQKPSRRMVPADSPASDRALKVTLGRSPERSRMAT